MTQRTQITRALHELVRSRVPDATYNDPLPTRIPDAGHVGIYMAENQDEPEETLSPLRYHWTLRLEIQCMSQHSDGRTREDVVDALLETIATLFPEPPDSITLGGLCDFARLAPPTVQDFPVDGSVPIRAAIIPVEVFYTTTSPLG